MEQRTRASWLCLQGVEKGASAASRGRRWLAHQMRALLSSAAWSTRFLDYSRDGRPHEHLRQVPRHKVGRSMPARGAHVLLLCILMCGGLHVSAQEQENCCIGEELDCSTSSVEHQGQVRPSASTLIAIAYCLGWSVMANQRP